MHKWLSSFLKNFNSNCAHDGGYCHQGYNFIIRLYFIVAAYIDKIFYEST